MQRSDLLQLLTFTSWDLMEDGAANHSGAGNRNDK